LIFRDQFILKELLFLIFFLFQELFFTNESNTFLNHFIFRYFYIIFLKVYKNNFDFFIINYYYFVEPNIILAYSNIIKFHKSNIIIHSQLAKLDRYIFYLPKYPIKNIFSHQFKVLFFPLSKIQTTIYLYFSTLYI
jgi:hypothetical protein